MTTAAATKTNNLVSSTLTVVKGKQEYTEQVKQLSNIAWQIAYTSLWNGAVFSNEEINNTKKAITHFLQQGTPLKQYAALAQRIILARHYILSHPGTYAPFPTQWFAQENKKGFAGTEKWLQTIEAQRQKMPTCKQALKAFPEAVLEVSQSQSANDFHYWRSYFAQQNAQGLLNLFLATIANMSHP
jgi:hypothetical protein